MTPQSEVGADSAALLAELAMDPATPETDRAEAIRRVARRARAAGLRIDPGPIETVPTKFGEVSVPVNDRIIGPALRADGMWEFAEAQLLGRLLGDGMVCVDIGAHVGTQTLVAARATSPNGLVIALEPDPRNFALLCRNVEANHVDNAIPLNLAAADVAAQMSLFRSPRNNSGDNRIRLRDSRTDEEPIAIVAVRVDDVLPADLPVHVVKSDSQGMDHRVLRGMERTLRRWRPVVIAEFWPAGILEVGDDPVEVVAHYRDHDYTISVLDYPALPPDALSDEEMVRLATGRYLTVVLRPMPREAR